MKTATSNVNFKLDTDVKESMEDACKAMGLTLTAAFTIFAKKVGTERRIPFEVAAPVSDYARALHRDSTAYRVGNYRVICDIVDSELLILAIDLGHRRDIYER